MAPRIKSAEDHLRALEKHVAAGNWAQARSDLKKGATCLPIDADRNMELWKNTIRVHGHGTGAPGAIQKPFGWEFLLDHGGKMPEGNSGLNLLAEVLNSGPLFYADWLADHGQVIPKDEAAAILVRGAMGYPGKKSLGWLVARGVPVDPPHPTFEPAVCWLMAVRKTNAMDWLTFLLDKGATARAWTSPTPTTDHTPLLTLTRQYVIETESAVRIGRPNPYAKFADFQALWDTLIAAGDDPNIRAFDGNTALDLAKQMPPFVAREEARVRAARAQESLALALPPARPRSRP